MLPYDNKLKELSQHLRNKPAKAEAMLWPHLRRKKLDGCQWYRQKPLDHYIVDFYCPKRKLVVELDGLQHYTPEALEYDKERDEILTGLGLKVLRFPNRAVFSDIGLVLQKIKLVNPP